MINIYELEKVVIAINHIIKFLKTHESRCGETCWRDEDDEGFDTDMGYFYDGLSDLKKYALNKYSRMTNTYFSERDVAALNKMIDAFSEADFKKIMEDDRK